MPFLVPFIPLIAAGVGVAGTVYASKKAGDATKAQVAGAKQAQDTTLKMYEQTRADLDPWAQAGKRGLAEYEKLAEEGPGEFQFEFEKDPGYQFEMREGESHTTESRCSWTTWKRWNREGSNPVCQ